MYKRQPFGLSKHFNLILLDELCMLLSFVAAYMIRHGLVNPFSNDAYVNVIVVFSLVNIVLIAYSGLFEGFLRRGYYQEFTKTLNHVILVEMFGVFYIFSMKTGTAYSRIVIYVFGILYLLSSYAATKDSSMQSSSSRIRLKCLDKPKGCLLYIAKLPFQ